MAEAKLGAVLVAAGRGSRMQADTPKQFQELAGRRLFTYALRTLFRSSDVESIAVVVPHGWETRVRAFCNAVDVIASRLCVVPGGETRQDSVHRGLQALDRCDEVLVHDAARPFLTQAQIAGVAVAARKHGAATIALPVTDTLLRDASAPGVPDTDASGAEVTGADVTTLLPVERRGMWAVQTPQAFARAVLLQAHEKARADGVHDATDDGSLVLARGHRLELVRGSWWNVKVTTPEDVQRAAWILQSGIVAEWSDAAQDAARQAAPDSSPAGGGGSR